MTDGGLNGSTTTIVAEVLRIRSRWLARLDDVAEGGWDQAITDVFVETLEAHARVLLAQVKDEQSARIYIKDLRRRGHALIENGEQRSVLKDPYNDARLRRIAGSSIGFIRKKLGLSPAQREQLLSEGVARIREDLRPKADRWQAWKAAMVYQIEIRLEAIYLHWEAEALDRVRDRGATAELGTDAGAKNAVETVPSDGRVENVRQRATSWLGVQISFLSDHRINLRNGDRLETYGYSELGFADQRNGKPNLAWIVLRTLAEHRGTLSGANSTAVAWTFIEKRIQEIRKTLRVRFDLPGDPLPLVSKTTYQAVFKIECAPCYKF